MWGVSGIVFRVGTAQCAVCTRDGGGVGGGGFTPAVAADFLAGGAYERRIYARHAGRGRTSVTHAHLCLLVAAASRVAADGGGGCGGGDDVGDDG